MQLLLALRRDQDQIRVAIQRDQPNYFRVHLEFFRVHLRQYWVQELWCWQRTQLIAEREFSRCSLDLLNQYCQWSSR